MSEAVWDVVVVGAGRGLLAAARAADWADAYCCSRKTPGRASKSSCRAARAATSRTPPITAASSPLTGRPVGSFIRVAALGVQETIALFESEGVATKVEETGKVFPVSNKAARRAGSPSPTACTAAVSLLLPRSRYSIVAREAGFRPDDAAPRRDGGRVILTTGGHRTPAAAPPATATPGPLVRPHHRLASAGLSCRSR